MTCTETIQSPVNGSGFIAVVIFECITEYNFNSPEKMFKYANISKAVICVVFDIGFMTYKPHETQNAFIT